jgi:hypothetical protein
MPAVAYVICAVTSAVSAFLLARSAKGPGSRLRFWSAVFFAGQTLNNILAFVDVWLGPEINLGLAPNLVALASSLALLYALIWESN